MEFTSVFEEATRDHESERRTAALDAATHEVGSLWPFLAQALSPQEFGHRLALSESRLTSIAQRHGLSYEDVTAPLVRGFEALQAHAKISGDPASQWKPSGEKCASCDHVDPTHTLGDACSCGCNSFTPASRKQATQHTATEPGSKGGPVGEKDNEAEGFMNHDSGDADGSPEQPTYPTRGSTLEYGGHPYPKQSSLTSYAALHQALMDGQDPLEWIAEQNPPGGPQYALVPSGHDETQQFAGTNPVAYTQAMENVGGSGAPEQPGGHSDKQSLGSRHPFA